MIATKIRDGEYNGTNGLEDDLNLMCKNAQSFNEPGSQIYKVVFATFVFIRNYTPLPHGGLILVDAYISP